MTGWAAAAAAALAALALLLKLLRDRAAAAVRGRDAAEAALEAAGERAARLREALEADAAARRRFADAKDGLDATPDAGLAGRANALFVPAGPGGAPGGAGADAAAEAGASRG